jgi:hypothetical protein
MQVKGLECATFDAYQLVIYILTLSQIVILENLPQGMPIP